MGEAWFETRPICFGRYVADVPRILRPGLGDTTLDGFKIVNLGEAGQSDLAAKVEERRALMEAGGESAGVDGRISTVPRTGYLYKKNNYGVIVLGYEADRVADFFPPPTVDFIETYFLSGGHLFEIKGRIEKDNRDARLESIFRIARATTPRDNEEVPREKGYCIENGFVAVEQLERDYAGAGFVSNDGTDRTAPSYGIGVGIASAAMSAGVGFTPASWLSEGRSRTVAAIPGHERLAVVDTGERRDSEIQFLYNAIQPPTDRRVGVEIDISLWKRGRPNTPPFTTEAAQQAWDTVLNSLRLR